LAHPVAFDSFLLHNIILFYFYCLLLTIYAIKTNDNNDDDDDNLCYCQKRQINMKISTKTANL